MTVAARRRKRPSDASGLLGSLEYAAMQALWAGAPASVKTVLGRINDGRPRDEQLAYTTVMTVLVRLHEKGLLDRVKAGRGYDYTPRFDEEQLVEHLGQREVSELLDRYGSVALSQFAAALGDADPETLRRITDLMGTDGRA